MDGSGYLLLSKALRYYRVREFDFARVSEFCKLFSREKSLLKPLSCTPSRINQMLRTVTDVCFWARSGFVTFDAPERECEIWGTVQSWASSFYPHVHMQVCVHVNITSVGTSGISFIMFDASSMAVLSSTCFSTLSLWLFLDTYWSFSCIFIKQHMFWFSLKCKKKKTNFLKHKSWIRKDKLEWDCLHTDIEKHTFKWNT